MDFKAVSITVLGLILAPLSLSAQAWVFDRVYPKFYSRTNRAQAQALLAALLSCVAFSAVMLFPLWVFGLYPLYSRGPQFFWSFSVGVVLFAAGVRFFRWFRSLAHAQAEAARRKKLHESIDIEIAERRHEYEERNH